MLTQTQVRRYSAQCGLRDMMIAEKEVVLTFLLQLLSQHGILDRLAFKGGTCLRKMFIGSQGRFSTDLDFTGLEEHGTPRPEDLRNAKYPLILQPLITAQDAESHVHALERAAVPTLKGRSSYVPIRFVPFEKISKHYKLMLAFDALVLWKASGQMPTKGTIIHGLQHAILRLRLDTLIHEVPSLVGKPKLPMLKRTVLHSK